MSSILKSVCNRFNDTELIDRASRILSSTWKILSISPKNYMMAKSICKNIQEYRKKISWLLVIMTNRGINFDDNGCLDYCKQKLIDISRKFKIPPTEFNETFESLGVTDIWTFNIEASVIDFEFQKKKDYLRKVGIQYIKDNPTCTENDLYAYLDSNFSADEAALGKYLIITYQNWAYKRGLITNNDFTSFRDFISNTSIDALEAL